MSLTGTGYSNPRPSDSLFLALPSKQDLHLSDQSFSPRWYPLIYGASTESVHCFGRWQPGQQQKSFWHTNKSQLEKCLKSAPRNSLQATASFQDCRGLGILAIRDLKVRTQEVFLLNPFKLTWVRSANASFAAKQPKLTLNHKSKSSLSKPTETNATLAAMHHPIYI